MTSHSAGLLSKVEKDYVDMAREDAGRLGLNEGNWVRLISPFGEVKTQVVITGELRPGEVYMPVCSSIERVNYLTSSDTDPVVKTPAYKEMSVRIEKLNRTGRSPMPRGRSGTTAISIGGGWPRTVDDPHTGFGASAVRPAPVRASASSGPVMNVVTSAMITSMVKMRGDRIPMS